MPVQPRLNRSIFNHRTLQSRNERSQLDRSFQCQYSIFREHLFPGRRSAGVGRSPGTFGELLQGALPAADSAMNNFLVTFPITEESVVVFSPNKESREIGAFPPGKRKSVRLIRKLLDSQNIKEGGTLFFLKQLPEGKGLASSSADMVASARAVSNCYQFDLSKTVLSAWMGEIEPTDGVMYDGCVAFFHRRCELISRLGALPPLVVVGIDEGSTIDTLKYNANVSLHSKTELDEYALLLKMISTAVGKKDLRLLGKVSTRSAEMNQAYNPKRYFSLAIATAEAFGALGVVVAHSGTYIGVLLDPMRRDFIRQFNQVKIALNQSSCPIEVFYSS